MNLPPSTLPTENSFAASQVLETYALLEDILAKLPAKTLFVLQQVSNARKVLVQQSQPIQEKIFLLIDGEAKMETVESVSPNICTVDWVSELSCRWSVRCTVTLSPSPSLFSEFGLYFSDNCRNAPIGRVHLTPTNLRVHILGNPEAASVGLRGVFLKHPPITSIRFFWCIGSGINEKEKVEVVHRPNGITLGTLLDFRAGLERKNLEAAFRMITDPDRAYNIGRYGACGRCRWIEERHED